MLKTESARGAVKVTSAVEPPPRTGAARGCSGRMLLSRVSMYLLMTVLAVPFVFPVYWMFITALKPLRDIFASPPQMWPAEPQWFNFAVPFVTSPFFRQFLNSTYIAALTTVGILLVGSLAGYAFARIRFRGRNTIFLMILSGMLIPAEVTIVPLYRLLDSFGWINTHLALIVPSIFGAPVVLSIFLMRQFFLSMPIELEQAARVDGLGRWGIFWRVAMPLARAPLAALGILAFLSSWNDFLEPLVFLRTPELWTIPLALRSFVDPASGVPIWNVQSAAMTLSVAPVLIVFMFAQKQFIQGIAGTGIK